MFNSEPSKDSTMKKFISVFIAMTALSALTAFASANAGNDKKTDYKKCFKACMKEVNDKDKCNYVCDDNIPPNTGK